MTQEGEMSRQPPNPELAALLNLFLLNEKNRAFVEGRSRRIFDTFYSDGWGTDSSFIFLVVVMITPLLLCCHSMWMLAGLPFQLNLFGVTTQGIVTDRQTSSDGETVSYHITYHFSIPEADRRFTNTVSVDENTFIRIEQQGSVSVTYLPNDPEISRLTDRIKMSLEGFLFLILLVIIIFGVPWLIWIFLFWKGLQSLVPQLRRDRRLVKQGKLLKGEVMSCKVTSYQDQDNHTHFYLTVRCGFYSPNGLKRKCSESTYMAREPIPPLPCTPLAVLYVDDTLYEVL
jgi:hypothetical protein